MGPEATGLQVRAETELRLPARLHPYQWDGIAFLYASGAALLADEMGLGKTVQAAVALSLLLNETGGVGRVLIVTPASLTTNWMVELEKWAPAVAVRRVQGGARQREAFYLLPIPVLVASYEQIRHDGLDRIPAGTFDLVIVDEAQRIKNRDSASALACRLLPRTRAWALTATPLENDPNDVLAILSFLDPATTTDASGARLKRRLESVMLRRRKCDVRADLPPVILQDLSVELYGTQRRAYDDSWFSRRSTIRPKKDSDDVTAALLGLITRLKLICNAADGVSSKWDVLEAMSDGFGSSARVLIFSQFVRTLRWIGARLKVSHDFLIGSMTLAHREEAIERFRSGPAPRVLLVSLRAGGVGLNLGEATHVVMFDRWWNPAVETQAIYRAHRFDRKDPLHVIRFLVKESIEERVAAILDRKAALFDSTIESVASRAGRLTRSELMDILQLRDA